MGSAELGLLSLVRSSHDLQRSLAKSFACTQPHRPSHVLDAQSAFGNIYSTRAEASVRWPGPLKTCRHLHLGLPTGTLDYHPG